MGKATGLGPELRKFWQQARTVTGVAGAAVRLMSDEEMRDLNRRFRGKDAATDVLSFAGTGDVAISMETAARQAAARRHATEIEIRILMLHGLLHLAGYDHERDEGEMRARERELRRQFGLPAGLIERSRNQTGTGAKKKTAGGQA